MKSQLLNLLCCPSCYKAFRLEEPVSQGSDIVSGSLICPNCKLRYPIINCVPVILDRVEGMTRTQEAFGKQWTLQDSGFFEQETIYGDSEEETLQIFLEAFDLVSNDASGKFFLDAGCGSGVLTRNIGRRAAQATVVGMDISDAAMVAHQNCKGLDNVHIVQCNLTRAPFRSSAFDNVWCSGVIHHTPSSQESFHWLDRLVAAKGKLYVWVYPSYKLSPYRLLRDLLWKPHRLPLFLRFGISFAAATFLFGALQLSRLFGRSAKKRSLRTLAYHFFDSLSPEYQHRHDRQEVRSWFQSHDYENIRILGDLGMAGTKQVREEDGRARQHVDGARNVSDTVSREGVAPE